MELYAFRWKTHMHRQQVNSKIISLNETARKKKKSPEHRQGGVAKQHGNCHI